jgi:hypothetical protein
MTPLLIGTYRKTKHIGDCLRSVDEHLTGISDITFIDDSGDPAHSAWLRQYGAVVETGGQGYTAAMKQLCKAANDRESFVLEEDFTFLTDVNTEELSEILFYRPHLAQIALLRGPHFPIEHQYGGLIEALQAKGHVFRQAGQIIEQTATFTANPSLWRADVFTTGWPTARWSEEVKRDQLIVRGYRFGYLPGIRVAHHGEREGTGY